MVTSKLEENSLPEALFLAPGKRLPKSRSRPRSSSSCSSSFLNSCPSACHSPTSPPKSSGIPFSWEDQPGVPKHLQSRANSSLTSSKSRQLQVIGSSLPPPPLSGSSNRLDHSLVFSVRKKVSNQKVHDPFFMALVECSKDKMAAEHGRKKQKDCKSRTQLLNLDRFQASCKTNVAVLESQVLLRRPHRSSYGLLTNRSA